MSSLTSQPSMNSLVTALEGSDRETGFDPRQLQKLSDYWEDTRKYYSGFEGDIKVPETEIYRYEIPGGQYTNLKPRWNPWDWDTSLRRSRRSTARSMTCWAVSSR